MMSDWYWGGVATMSLPRMSLHIGDYKKDTGHLGAAEHGAYLLLTMHYWATGGLPNDDARLARIACMTDEEWRGALPTIAALFQPGWRHKRIDLELANAQEKYDKLSTAGKKGGRPKKGKPSESQAFQTLKPLESHPKATPTLTKKEEVSRGGDAGAREPDLTNVFELTLRIGAMAGYPDASYWPPGWKDASLRVGLMLSQGWQPEIILAAVAQAMASKVDGPPFSINFFEKPIARAHARAAKPLPIVEEPSSHENSQRSLALLRPLSGGGGGLTSIGVAYARKAGQSSGGAAG